MKKTIQIGITKTQTVTTATTRDLIIPKWYNIELSDEYMDDEDEDGIPELHYQKGLTVKCLDVQGAISQGETEDEALDNIREVIQLLEEENISQQEVKDISKKFLDENKDLMERIPPD